MYNIPHIYCEKINLLVKEEKIKRINERLENNWE